MTRRTAITDPCELMIADALDAAGIDYLAEDPESGLDFGLTASGIKLEVKQFHSERIAAQMSRAENVIAVQGRAAVEYMASLIRGA